MIFTVIPKGKYKCYPEMEIRAGSSEKALRLYLKMYRIPFNSVLKDTPMNRLRVNAYVGKELFSEEYFQLFHFWVAADLSSGVGDYFMLDCP